VRRKKATPRENAKQIMKSVLLKLIKVKQLCKQMRYSNCLSSAVQCSAIVK